MLVLEALDTLLAHRYGTERGASLVEYALLIALIAMACLAAVTQLGAAVTSSFNSSAGVL